MKTFVSIAGLAAVLAMGPAFADDDPTVAEQITDAVTQADSEDAAPGEGAVVDDYPREKSP